MIDYTQYNSPFSWRYSSPEMRRIWSEFNKRILWRKIWLALAEVQSDLGLIPSAHLEDIRNHISDVDMALSLELETQLHHDLMAELKAFSSQCPVGGGSLHLGATSMDIEDNADALRLRESTQLILFRLRDLLSAFSDRISEFINTPCMAYTHLQPAEPTTYGGRFAFYAQDLLEDYEMLLNFLPTIRGKGFKGAVGTASSYSELIGKDNLTIFEARLSSKLDLPFYLLTNQTYPRRQEFSLLNILASIALTLNKFAFDIRFLQSPQIGEISEPFGHNQVGSSAMPFKRNPINAEKINSLSRALAQAPLTAWHNAANSLLERTLDDSANRRTLLPEAFLSVDELIITSVKVIRGLQVHQTKIKQNYETYAPFAATERLLMALVRCGANRQDMHELIRSHSLVAWAAIQSGNPNPLFSLLINEQQFRQWLLPDEIQSHLTIDGYLGDIFLRTQTFLRRLDSILSS